MRWLFGRKKMGICPKLLPLASETRKHMQVNENGFWRCKDTVLVRGDLDQNISPCTGGVSLSAVPPAVPPAGGRDSLSLASASLGSGSLKEGSQYVGYICTNQVG